MNHFLFLKKCELNKCFLLFDVKAVEVVKWKYLKLSIWVDVLAYIRPLIIKRVQGSGPLINRSEGNSQILLTNEMDIKI